MFLLIYYDKLTTKLLLARKSAFYSFVPTFNSTSLSSDGRFGEHLERPHR